MKYARLILLLLVLPTVVSGQLDSLLSNLDFEADFRFRIEQDFDSKKSDGTFRDDRTRLRYRVRAGVQYEKNWYRAGLRARTGNPAKQQDPQLTLGDGFKEFGTLPFALEKAYFLGQLNTFSFWLGKNSFPFDKSNELFWSDNVYPEGVYLNKAFSLESGIMNSFDIRAGHFIMSTAGKSLKADSYFQAYQLNAKLFDKRFELFPAIYLYRNVPLIPDGGGSNVIDYTILHIGSRFKIIDQPSLSLEVDFYNNIEDYTQNNVVPTDFKEETSGYTIGLKIGSLKEKGNWMCTATYAYLQQFSAVDYMAQNDWARWDYSSSGSPDGRLTNFNGVELVVGYKLEENLNLKLKAYKVEQLISYDTEKETGSRVRLDLDMKF